MKKSLKKDVVMIDVEGIELGKSANHPRLRENLMRAIDELLEEDFKVPIRFPIYDGDEKIGNVTVIGVPKK
jgi:hypothetical protein